MDRRMLVGLLAITAFVESQPAVLAADAEEKGHTYGHATFTFKARCTADVETKNADGSGHDTLTVTFTETHECKLDRFPNNPKFAPYLESWTSNVSVAGRGKYVPNDPERPPCTWHYETEKQFEDHIGNWYNGTFTAEDFDWDVSIGGFVGSVKIVPEQGTGGQCPALSSAGLALFEGSFGSTEEMKLNVIMRKEPAPLEWWFALPEDLSKPITCTAHKTYTGGTDLPPGDTGSARIQVDYDFHFVPPGCTEPPKPEVELQEIDRQWLPEEANSLTATVNVTGDKPATAFQFKLSDVSQEPGACCNSDDDNTDPDLSFAPSRGGWKVEPGDGVSIATSDEGGRSASIEIACHDWGAWGKLQAQAKIEGKWVPAKVAGSGLGFVRIPYDDDDDHIADAWQQEENVADKAPEVDDDQVPEGQANDGDGMSVYEEYRGFYVSDGQGGRTHKSLDPQVKEFFVIDEGGILDIAAWRPASGITAYLLRPDMARPGATPEAARLVNFRSGNAHTGSKYAVVITKIDNSGAATQRGPQDWECGETNNGISSPKDVQYCRVYVDRIRRWVEDVATRLRVAVTEPNSPDAQTFEKSGFPRWMWKAALEKLGEATIESLTQQNVRWTAVHEVGHCCGLPGHAAGPNGAETTKGNPHCFMCYSDDGRNMQYIILQALFKPNAAQPMTYDHFCHSADYNCWGHLNVKDN